MPTAKFNKFGRFGVAAGSGGGGVVPRTVDTTLIKADNTIVKVDRA